MELYVIYFTSEKSVIGLTALIIHRIVTDRPQNKYTLWKRRTWTNYATKTQTNQNIIAQEKDDRW